MSESRGVCGEAKFARSDQAATCDFRLVEKGATFGPKTAFFARGRKLARPNGQNLYNVYICSFWQSPRIRYTPVQIARQGQRFRVRRSEVRSQRSQVSSSGFL